MFNTHIRQQLAACQQQLSEALDRQAAVDRSMATIEFEPDGTIITANDNLLNTLGYRLEDIRGQHHRLFCDPEYADSADYRQFWRQLGNGEFIRQRFLRLNKQGRPVWLEASYNPICDQQGRVIKVLKIATDITPAVIREHEEHSLINAINRSMAVIEFNLQGEVLSANDNFLALMGYRLEDIRGRHHRLFCDAQESDSADYRQFWERLNRGEFFTGRFKRINRQGSIVWLRATYNPVFDVQGRLYKVVKLASDITEQILQQESESRAARMAYDTSLQTDNTAQQGAEVVQKTVEVMQVIAGECTTLPTASAPSASNRK